MKQNLFQDVNKWFLEVFANADTIKHAETVSDIDSTVKNAICSHIPAALVRILDTNSAQYVIKGSVGAGRATKTPWIAIMDKDITTTTREGVYIVFLFSSDYKHVYLTLNQGTTVPGQFGVRLNKKDISRNSTRIRELLQEEDPYLGSDNNVDVSDERYKEGAIYYTLWDEKDSNEGEKILNLYFRIYARYKKLLSLQGSIIPEMQRYFTPLRISSIIDAIQSTGLIYSDTLIKRFAYSLLAKPFVILSGLAGSGKTQLALVFAKCLSENIEEQLCTVAVGADWTNREPLLGYPNALKSGEYVLPESGVLQLLMRANENPDKPYFLILDEMNLSVVERYFADFLSAMESGESIKLWDKGNKDVPDRVALPKNVFVIGTINVDETTYMFSPKVLDRANVIEFKIAHEEMEQFLKGQKAIDREAANSTCSDMAADFVAKAKGDVKADKKDETTEILMLFFRELKKVHAEFGYRSVHEIYRYIGFAGEELSDNGAVDTAILQKLLPKLHGSRKKLVPILTSMWGLCQNEGQNIEIEADLGDAQIWSLFKYPESAEKIQRMYNAVVDNGFTSFAEA